MKAIVFFAASMAWAAPCTTATSPCTEWVPLAGGTLRSFVYRTYPLDTKDQRITRALVIVHGQGRNADHYFRTGLAAAFLAGALEDTLIVAPRLSSNDGASCRDRLEPDEVNWPCSGNSWRSGGVAVNESGLTSYDFMDEILRRLARKEVFPNLKTVVVSGHSAGGQFVERYAMANQVHESLGVRVHYVVSNPSSYAYLDAARPAEGGIFRPFADGRNCTGYDRWPYGLQARAGYAARLETEQLQKQIAARPVTYLLGELDTLPLAGFDSSCPAMAQGPSRLARGQAFQKYINTKYGAHHEVTVAPMCGHNARCVFTTEEALPVLFPARGSLP